MFLILAVSVTGVIAADSIGKIVALEGSGRVESAGGTVRQMSINLPVFLQDKVFTDVNSKIQIMFNDDSVVSQGEKSQMTIDEYLYSPQKKEVSCSLKMAMGVFRVVTGKITDMNPDRFKVKTRMATIGIRGCEVGFKISQKSEDVYIIELPEGKSIIVEKILLPGEMLDQAVSLERVLSIVDEGVVVSIAEGAGLVQREVTPAEARDFIMESTMQGSGTSSENSSDESVIEPESVGSEPGAGIVDQSVLDAAETKSEEENTTASQDGNNSTAETQIAPRGSFSDWRNMTAEELAAQADALKYREPPPPPPPPPDPPGPPPTPPPTDPGPAAISDGAPDVSWEWGIWMDGNVFYAANGFGGMRFLASSELQEIIGGAAEYNLSGSGRAGAVLKEGANTAKVQGICDMAVQVGGATGNKWQGEYHMNNANADSLDFNAAGTVTANGLSGQVVERTTPYSMKVGNATLTKGTITSESIDGALIGEGSTIYGTAGEFHIKHNNGAASADGAFGADLY